jgi:hypothetical protein
VMSVTAALSPDAIDSYPYPIVDWQQQLDYGIVGSLLADADPAVTYFARRDLLDESVGPVKLLWEQERPKRLLRRQREDGSWRGPAKKTPVYPDNHSDLIATFKQVRLLVAEPAHGDGIVTPAPDTGVGSGHAEGRGLVLVQPGPRWAVEHHE